MDPLSYILSVKQELEDQLFWKDLSTKPPFYDHILQKIFCYPELPIILRNKKITEVDESVRMFFSVLSEFRILSSNDRIAVIGGGSAVLIEKLLHHFDHRALIIHNYDNSEYMLKRDQLSQLKIKVDLSKPFTSFFRYDLVLSIGCLRYFSENLQAFVQNILNLADEGSLLLIGEIDRILIISLSKMLTKQGLVTKIIKREGYVFRNTLFYFLYDLYRKNIEFRRNVDILAAESSEWQNILINLAGFKKVPYYFSLTNR
jgi:hypothetical protein